MEKNILVLLFNYCKEKNHAHITFAFQFSSCRGEIKYMQHLTKKAFFHSTSRVMEKKICVYDTTHMTHKVVLWSLVCSLFTHSFFTGGDAGNQDNRVATAQCIQVLTLILMNPVMPCLIGRGTAPKRASPPYWGFALRWPKYPLLVTLVQRKSIFQCLSSPNTFPCSVHSYSGDWGRVL